MKNCAICKSKKRLQDFNKNKTNEDGLQSICKECSRKKSREYYQRNKEKHKQATYKRKEEQKLVCKEWIWKYFKKHHCVDCGESDPLVLEFDHVPSKGDKRYNISRILGSNPTLKTLKEEVKKCDVRCVNCHRRKTSIDFNHWRNQFSET